MSIVDPMHGNNRRKNQLIGYNGYSKAVKTCREIDGNTHRANIAMAGYFY
jgi:hypothetical protein